MKPINPAITGHKVVSRDEWIAARKELLIKEKEQTRMRDQLAAERRALLWVKVEKEYVFDADKPALPKIVSREQWRVARNKLLAKEKAATRARDALNAERRRLPRMRIEKDYVFDGPDNGDEVFHTYFTDGLGVEYLGSTWSFLDPTPYRRQETWEDSPKGWPQTPPYTWWRLHDEY